MPEFARAGLYRYFKFRPGLPWEFLGNPSDGNQWKWGGEGGGTEELGWPQPDTGLKVLPAGGGGRGGPILNHVNDGIM